MIKFNKPTNFNGAELRDELRAAGVQISDDWTSVRENNEGELELEIDPADESKAKKVIEKHNGTIVAPELTVADKLASVGLNLDDLKAALGI